jgi:membrane protease YdiL (CAAX protease family)
MALFNWVSGITRDEQGFSTRANLSAMWIAVAGLVLASALMVTGYVAGTLNEMVGFTNPLPHIAAYGTWAFIQEWMSLGFVFVRLQRILSARWAVLTLAAIFAFAHVPNVTLMLVTFAMSAVFALLFRRHRALAPFAIAHAAMGLALAVACPPWLTHYMRVGAIYWRW